MWRGSSVIMGIGYAQGSGGGPRASRACLGSFAGLGRACAGWLVRQA